MRNKMARILLALGTLAAALVSGGAGTKIGSRQFITVQIIFLHRMGLFTFAESFMIPKNQFFYVLIHVGEDTLHFVLLAF